MTKAMATQLADLKTNFQAAGVEIDSSLAKGLTKAALIVERDYKVRLTKGGQVATGLLRASASHRLIDGKRYMQAQVGSNTGYAAEVELGGPPRHVPFEDILNWVRRKGLAGSSYASNKMGSSYKSGVEKTIAKAIQDSIAEKGTMPHPALLPALVSNRDAIFKAIANQLKSTLSQKGARSAS